MSRLLFEPVKAASRVSDSVIVAFSGGKDSVVTLDLCARYFKTVHVFFMYLVPGLSFQEAAMRWVEKRYGLETYRVPHFMLSEWLALGTFRKEDAAVPMVTPRDIYQHVRLHFDCWWVAAGERQADSIIRRAMMKKSGSIDEPRGRFYPVAHFKKADVVRYIAAHQLKVSPESPWLGHSFRSLEPEEMFLVKHHYPADFERIQAMFPFVGASVMKFEMDEPEKARRLNRGR